jgi:hypothetical protein
LRQLYRVPGATPDGQGDARKDFNLRWFEGGIYFAVR